MSDESVDHPRHPDARIGYYCHVCKTELAVSAVGRHEIAENGGVPYCNPCGLPIARKLAELTPEEVRAALEESVRLQSHYASILNAYDGGQRLQFANGEVWIERLRSISLRQGAHVAMRGELRPVSEIEAAHDRLTAIVLGEVPNPFAPDVMLSVQSALDVLCWVLNHDHNDTFAGNRARGCSVKRPSNLLFASG